MSDYNKLRLYAGMYLFSVVQLAQNHRATLYRKIHTRILIFLLAFFYYFLVLDVKNFIFFIKNINIIFSKGCVDIISNKFAHELNSKYPAPFLIVSHRSDIMLRLRRDSFMGQVIYARLILMGRFILASRIRSALVPPYSLSDSYLRYMFPQQIIFQRIFEVMGFAKSAQTDTFPLDAIRCYFLKFLKKRIAIYQKKNSSYSLNGYSSIVRDRSVLLSGPSKPQPYLLCDYDLKVQLNLFKGLSPDEVKGIDAQNLPDITYYNLASVKTRSAAINAAIKKNIWVNINYGALGLFELAEDEENWRYFLPFSDLYLSGHPMLLQSALLDLIACGAKIIYISDVTFYYGGINYQNSYISGLSIGVYESAFRMHDVISNFILTKALVSLGLVKPLGLAKEILEVHVFEYASAIQSIKYE